MKKNKTIGLQLDTLESAVVDEIWPELYRSFKARGYNLLIFPGRTLRSPIPLDYQYNRIYNFISPKTVDALILTSGLDFFTSIEEQSKILDEFGSIPKISMGSLLSGIPAVLTDNRKAVTAVVDHLKTVHKRKRIAFISGPQGSYESVSRRQGYLDYFLENDKTADPDLMVDGLDYFEYSGAAGVIELLQKADKSFDGLVCSSDSQAVGAYQELVKQGIRVPQDVSLFGFDDIPMSKAKLIGLSTVYQPLKEMCEKTVELMEELLEGKEVPPITTLPLSLSFRNTCGCFSENMMHMDQVSIIKKDSRVESPFPVDNLVLFFRNVALGERFVKLLEQRITSLMQSENFDKDSTHILGELNHLLSRQEMERMEITNWHPILTIIIDWMYRQPLKELRFREMARFFQKVRIMMGDKQNILDNIKSQKNIQHSEVLRILSQRFIFTSDFKQIEHALGETIKTLGIGSFHIYLFEGESGPEREFYLPLPQYSRPEISCMDHCSKTMSRRRVKTEKIMNESMKKGSNFHYIVLPLFQSDELIGYMLLEPEVEVGAFYINLIFLLSSVIKSVVLFQSREEYQKIIKKTLKELEKSNKKLEEQNRIDPLTTLYNRRGFYLLAENQLQLVRRMKKSGLIFFGDLDGLKKINDNWGHKAGDEAIAGAAWALKNTFRSSDVLARFGGDEFVVMTIDADESTLVEIQQRLQNNLRRKNKDGRGYEISLSLGHLLINEGNSHLNLDELLHLADQKLYQEKQRKKGRQGKN